MTGLGSASGRDGHAPVPEVRLVHRTEAGRTWPVLVWECGAGWRAVSSTVVGGGLGGRRWWLNTQVDKEYFHPDPEVHAQKIAAGLGLTGPGVAMLTAADVARRAAARDGGVHVTATVGLGLPVLAAVSPQEAEAETAPGAGRVGTINVLAVIPVPLADAALVNAVGTATEAKVQALAQAGVRGTGTSSDAVCIACPVPGPGDAAVEPYGGPRSTWGARLARAVHAAVTEGTHRWTADAGGR